MDASDDPITAGLIAARAAKGPHASAMQQVYLDLVRIARAELGRHRRGATLNTSALVNEAYLKLYGQTTPAFASRRHFYATAARAMRQVVIDHARSRLAGIRGGGAEHLSLDALDAAALPVEEQAENLVRLDAALHKLGALDPRLAEVIELRFFTGLEVEQVAELLNTSTATVKRDTRTARAFLACELSAAG